MTPPASFDVILRDAGGNKLNVVNVVKTILGVSLKAAKDLVDAAPSPVKQNIGQAEADAIRAQLVAGGATVVIVPHGQPTPADPSPPVEAPATGFDVILRDAGGNKLNVVNVVKAILGISLKEAKDLVDAAPVPIEQNVSQAEANAIAAQLVASGATVRIVRQGVPAPPDPAPPVEAPATGFDVILRDAGGNKLNVVNVVKTILGVSLKEAKDLVDAAPSPVKQNVSEAEANATRAQLVASGATVLVQSSGHPLAP